MKCARDRTTWQAGQSIWRDTPEVNNSRIMLSLFHRGEILHQTQKTDFYSDPWTASLYPDTLQIAYQMCLDSWTDGQHFQISISRAWHQYLAMSLC